MSCGSAEVSGTHTGQDTPALKDLHTAAIRSRELLVLSVCVQEHKCAHKSRTVHASTDGCKVQSATSDG